METLPIIALLAWGIGYLTGNIIARREYKEDVACLRSQMMKSRAQIEREVSNRVTEDFFAKLAKLGITLERIALLVEKECEHCADRSKCAIYDNFNIDFCSDWREEKSGTEKCKSGTEQS